MVWTTSVQSSNTHGEHRRTSSLYSSVWGSEPVSYQCLTTQIWLKLIASPINHLAGLLQNVRTMHRVFIIMVSDVAISKTKQRHFLWLFLHRCSRHVEWDNIHDYCSRYESAFLLYYRLWWMATIVLESRNQKLYFSTIGFWRCFVCLEPCKSHL